MKASYTEQYDLSLSKREMERLVQSVRIFVRDYEASEEDEQLLASLEQVFKGSTGGRSVELRALTDPEMESDDDDAAQAA